MISLPFKLKTDTATIYDIPEECINNFRAIVLSDHYFGLCIDIKKVFLFLNQSWNMFIYSWNTVDYNSPNYIESFKP